LRQNYVAYKEMGVEVLAICPQEASIGAKLKGSLGLPFTLLSDPGCRVIKSYGIFHENEPKGRDIPYPSTFIVDEGGSVIWRYIGKDSSDRPAYRTLVEALKISEE
jgi:peroxiredoxin